MLSRARAVSRALQLGLACFAFLLLLPIHAAPTPDLAPPWNETSYSPKQPRLLSARDLFNPRIEALATQIGQGSDGKDLFKYYWYTPYSTQEALPINDGILKVNETWLDAGSSGVVLGAKIGPAPPPGDLGCLDLESIAFRKRNWAVKRVEGKGAQKARQGARI